MVFITIHNRTTGVPLAISVQWSVREEMWKHEMIVSMSAVMGATKPMMVWQKQQQMRNKRQHLNS